LGGGIKKEKKGIATSRAYSSPEPRKKKGHKEGSGERSQAKE